MNGDEPILQSTSDIENVPIEYRDNVFFFDSPPGHDYLRSFHDEENFSVPTDSKDYQNEFQFFQETSPELLHNPKLNSSHIKGLITGIQLAELNSHHENASSDDGNFNKPQFETRNAISSSLHRRSKSISKEKIKSFIKDIRHKSFLEKNNDTLSHQNDTHSSPNYRPSSSQLTRLNNPSHKDQETNINHNNNDDSSDDLLLLTEAENPTPTSAEMEEAPGAPNFEHENNLADFMFVPFSQDDDSANRYKNEDDFFVDDSSFSLDDGDFYFRKTANAQLSTGQQQSIENDISYQDTKTIPNLNSIDMMQQEEGDNNDFAPEASNARTNSKQKQSPWRKLRSRSSGRPGSRSGSRPGSRMGPVPASDLGPKIGLGLPGESGSKSDFTGDGNDINKDNKHPEFQLPRIMSHRRAHKGRTNEDHYTKDVGSGIYEEYDNSTSVKNSNIKQKFPIQRDQRFSEPQEGILHHYEHDSEREYEHDMKPEPESQSEVEPEPTPNGFKRYFRQFLGYRIQPAIQNHQKRKSRNSKSKDSGSQSRSGEIARTGAQENTEGIFSSPGRDHRVGRSSSASGKKSRRSASEISLSLPFSSNRASKSDSEIRSHELGAQLNTQQDSTYELLDRDRDRDREAYSSSRPQHRHALFGFSKLFLSPESSRYDNSDG